MVSQIILQGECVLENDRCSAGCFYHKLGFDQLNVAQMGLAKSTI